MHFTVSWKGLDLLCSSMMGVPLPWPIAFVRLAVCLCLHDHRRLSTPLYTHEFEAVQLKLQELLSLSAPDKFSEPMMTHGPRQNFFSCIV